MSRSMTALHHLPLDKQIISLLEEVGNRILEQYTQVEHGVIYKSDKSPQTIADRISHDQISRFLQSNSPFPVFSEEAVTETEIREDTFWTLDPLDGTQDFIHKTGEFAVMISLVAGPTPVFGLVYQPVTGRIYAAEKGRGAYSIERSGSESQLHVSNNVQLEQTRMVVSRSHPQRTDVEVAKALKTTSMVPQGSFGLKIGLIARGEAELLLYPPKVTSLWDSAPNVVILSEAGGRITDLDGRDLTVDPHNPRNQRGVIATNGRNHDQLLEIVRRVLT